MPRVKGRLSAAVVGAGAFGGWTALSLLRRGARVTLLDAWGPGNPRSSSGGESRVIRGLYGGDAIYADWAALSLARWRAAGRRWGRRFYRKTGGLWMFRGDDTYARLALPHMKEAGLRIERLPLRVAARRFPQVRFTGVRSVYYEPEAGYLLAREACRAVADAVVREGGRYGRAEALPGRITRGALDGLRLSGGSRLEADAYVFACGPWLGSLFPGVVGDRVRPTRQEVLFFGAPPGDDRFDADALPVWVDFGARVVYGIPGHEGRGFKFADDTRGPEVDPTSLDRAPDPAGIRRARRFLAERFPDLAGAPLLESRVCQYENSPDADFIIDRHPGAANTFLVGGGSGHGFKFGPAVGEHAAALVMGTGRPNPRFALGRFGRRGARPPVTQFAAGSKA